MSATPLLDYAEGMRRQDAGLDLTEQFHRGFLDRMRELAEKIAARSGVCSTDELRPIAELEGWTPSSASWGAVFRVRGWVRCDSKRSAWPSNHGRYISVYRRTA